MQDGEQEFDQRIATLKAALIAGEESGSPVAFDREDFLARMRAKYILFIPDGETK